MTAIHAESRGESEQVMWREAFRTRRAEQAPTSESAFFSVAQAARIFGMSTMTLYRAINAGEFPAIRIRGRVIIPAQAINEMVEAALSGDRLVDAADWARPETR